MSVGSLAVVEAWMEAVNTRALTRVCELSADPVHVAGPQGAGPIPSQELAAWVTRSGFSAAPRRWFCGQHGAVVAEQDAQWEDTASGARLGAALVASHFQVANGVVSSIGRHEDLVAALDAANLRTSDEVTMRR